jgi:hypothetical protein
MMSTSTLCFAPTGPRRRENRAEKSASGFERRRIGCSVATRCRLPSPIDLNFVMSCPAAATGNIYIYIYIYIYVHIHTHTHTHTHTHIHIMDYRVQERARERARERERESERASERERPSHLEVECGSNDRLRYMYKDICTHASKDICTHTHIQRYMHTHIQVVGLFCFYSRSLSLL